MPTIPVTALRSYQFLVLITVLIILNIAYLLTHFQWLLGFDNRENSAISCSKFQTLEGLKNSEGTETQTDPKIVPFYVYEEYNFYLHCNSSKSHYKVLPALKAWSENMHGDDVVFNRQIIHHKWRTRDKKKAKIFVIPALLNFMTNEKSFADRCNLGVEVDSYQFLEKQAEFIMNQDSFIEARNKGIYNHLLVSSYWKLRSTTFLDFNTRFAKETKYKKFRKLWLNSIHGSFEILRNTNYNFDGYKTWPPAWRCTIVIPYVDKPHFYRANAKYDTKILKDEKTGILSLIGGEPYHKMYGTNHDQNVYDYDRWKSRTYDFFFMGGLTGHKSYMTRRKLNLYIKDGFFDNKNLLMRTHLRNEEYKRERNFTFLYPGPDVFPEEDAPPESYPNLNYIFAGSQNKFFNLSQIQDYENRKHLVEELQDTKAQERERILLEEENVTEISKECSLQYDCLDRGRCYSCYMGKEMQSNYTNFNLDSKFTLVIHGDTPSTSRLYDAISSGSIPIVISSDIYFQGLPFLTKVPYHLFSFFLNHDRSGETIVNQILDIVMSTPEHVLKDKLKLMREYVRDVSWNHPKSKVVENIMIEAASGHCRL